MPITLGCPSCGKRFRARDESVGKRVKCPFCQAAVPVPSPEEAHNASAPTEVVPAAPSSVPPQPQTRSVPPGPVPVSSPGDWGATPPADPEQADVEPIPAFPPPPRPARNPPAPPAKGKGGKAPKADKTPKTPEESLAAAWGKSAGGLGWVLFGLFWIALIGFVPFGKVVYERSVGELPRGEGWVKIDGYVNDNVPNAIAISKTDEINLLAYGLPILFGGLALTLGRLTAGAAPRNSGAKGLFGFSGLFTLVALAAYPTFILCTRYGFKDIAGYAESALWVGVPLMEFWFLLALGAAGATLKRPKAVRTVGAYALMLGFGYLVGTVGWEQYVKNGSDLGRPKPLDADWKMYEEAARMLGWLLLVGLYWRAVSSVRGAAKEFVRDVEDRKPA